MKYSSPSKVITGPETRWSYANVWEPKSIGGGRPRYSVCLIISKSDTATIEKIRQAIRAAYEEGQFKLRGSGKAVPALEELHQPLRDGDRERPGDPAYAGCLFMNATSTVAPGIVDGNRRTILDHSEVYSGVYGRASVSFYAYSVNGSKGIACALNHLQKLRDGTPLGYRSTAEDDFASDEEEDDCPF